MKSDHTPPLENLVIRASAGSGKTFQLTNRYIALLNADVPVPHILATTFTRKAAGEILSRTLERLAAGASDEKPCRELAEQIKDNSLRPGRCYELLKRLIDDLHRLRISTLDSFFAQAAGSHSLELALPPGWRIVDELVDRRLRVQAIENVLRGESFSEVTRLMNLINQGAAERSVNETIRSTVNNLYDLYLETDQQAWRQIPRPPKLSEAELADALIALEEAPLPEDKRFETARNKDLGLAQQLQWNTFIAKGLAAKVRDGTLLYYGKEIPPPTVAIYQRLLGHARAILLGQLANQTEGTYELLDKFHAEYERLKHDQGALRFEDVTRRLQDLLQTASEQSLAFRMDGRLEHLLLDEFQDTSLAQWEVLRPLAESITNEKRGTFFCVGDVKQAIYGWRGGVAEVFEAASAHLGGLKEAHLERSYRSSPPVIEAVNALFTGLERHPNLGGAEAAVQTWCEQFAEHETTRTQLAGYVALETAALDDGERGTTLAYAAGRVAQLAADSPGRTIGVLVRSNVAVGKLIYELGQRGVSASEEGGIPLTNSAAVQIVLSLLRLADHPGDQVSWYHVARSPLGPKLGLDPVAGADQRTRVADEFRARLLRDSYGATIRSWAQMLMDSCSHREAGRLKHLVDLAFQYEASATTRPSSFVELVEFQRVSDPESAGIRVMTIHQAKGLEFDIVVLPELDKLFPGQPDAYVVGRETETSPVTAVCLHRKQDIQALLPARLQTLFERAQARDVAESLCVLYVAVTRAIRALHVIVAPSKPNEKNLPKTYAGLVRAAWIGTDSMSEQSVLYQRGDPAWHATDGPPAEAVAAGSNTESKRELAPVQWKPPQVPATRRRGLASSSPSQLEGGSLVAVADLFCRDRSNAMARGTLIHAWFEQIAWLDEGAPTADRLRQIATRLQIADPDIEALLSDFQGMLQQEAIAAALRRSAYQPPKDLLFDEALIADLAAAELELEVRSEQPIAALGDASLMTGSIDRLVLMRRDSTLLAADVIDFKSDVVDATDEAALAEKVAFYRPQLEAYRDAVAAMFRLERRRISARLLFVAAGVVKAVR